MGEPRSSGNAATSNKPSPPPSPSPMPPQPLTLLQPIEKKKSKPVKALRLFRSVVRTFPIMNPACKLPHIPISFPDSRHHTNGTRVTGTLFGHRKGRVSLSIQENPKCLPTVVIELAMQTNALQKELTIGMVRIALECEKRLEKDKMKIQDEPMWTMYCNGKKYGYSVKRAATEVDLNVMELLKPVSMGAGVLPGKSKAEGPDGELAYIRAHFDRVTGSKDSVTLYMLGPEGNNGPELSIFFIRL